MLVNFSKLFSVVLIISSMCSVLLLTISSNRCLLYFYSFYSLDISFAFISAIAPLLSSSTFPLGSLSSFSSFLALFTQKLLDFCRWSFWFLLVRSRIFDFRSKKAGWVHDSFAGDRYISSHTFRKYNYQNTSNISALQRN